MAEPKLTRFLNHYECPRCGHEWSDHWDCMVDDDCPNCGCRHISPSESEGPFDEEDEEDDETGRGRSPALLPALMRDSTMRIDYQRFVMPALLLYVASIGACIVSGYGLLPLYTLSLILTSFLAIFAWNWIAPRIMGDADHEPEQEEA